MTNQDGTGSTRRSLEAFREVVRGELAAARSALDDVRAMRTQGFDDDEHDPDGAPLSTEWSRLEGRRRAAEERLAEVDRALLDVDAGRYGTCADCGRPISPGRLAARPSAVVCVVCAGSR